MQRQSKNFSRPFISSLSRNSILLQNTDLTPVVNEHQLIYAIFKSQESSIILPFFPAEWWILSSGHLVFKKYIFKDFFLVSLQHFWQIP